MDAKELASAAARLRELVPRFRETPVTEFVPIAVAGLLDGSRTASPGAIRCAMRSRSALLSWLGTCRAPTESSAGRPLVFRSIC